MFKLLSDYESILKCPDCRIVVSRSHQGDVMKMAEKFKPPGVVTPAGGAGFKVIIISNYFFGGVGKEIFCITCYHLDIVLHTAHILM